MVHDLFEDDLFKLITKIKFTKLFYNFQPKIQKDTKSTKKQKKISLTVC